MNLKFKNIRMVNFMSFGDTEVALDIPGFTLVSGVNRNQNDSAVSNGSGKSSIWEAISWCLTGDTIRGCKNVTNINGNDGALVELTFDLDGHEYIITRTKDHSKLKSNLKIMIDGQDKSGKGIRDGQQLLSQYLPDVTSSLIGSVIILGQGLPQKFSNNTPSGRKDVLEKLSRSDFMIEDIKDRVAKRISNFNATKRKYEDELVKLETELNIHKSTLSNAQSRLDNMGSATNLQESVNSLKADIQNVNAEIRNVNDKLPEQQAVRDSLMIQISGLVEKEKNEISSVQDSYVYVADLDTRANELHSDIRALDKVIKEKQSIKDVCPTCGQKLVGVTKPDITNDKIQLDKLLEDYDSVKEERDKVKEERDLKISEVAERFKAERNRIQLSINQYDSNIKQLNSSLSAYNNRLIKLTQDLSENENKLFNFNSTKQQLSDTVASISWEIGEIESKILYNKHEVDNVNSHLEVLNKMNTYIKRDFRGYLLTNVISYLDNKAKLYCNDVYGHTNISFALDGNNISISINDKEYEQLSGGERQKVDLIVQLAIRDMLCKYSNFSSNIFVLDEIFDNLDEVGSEKVLSMLTNRLEDVSTIFIVTHHSSIPIPVDRQLIVVKDSTGISRIEG